MARFGRRLELQLRALVFALFAAFALLAADAVAPGQLVTIGAEGAGPPAELTVRSGERVVWQYLGAEPREVRIAPAAGGAPGRGAWRERSRVLSRGERWTQRLVEPGAYVVTLGPGAAEAVVGTVVVTR
ncbi:MAG TPA: hypothetical protein PKD53_00795 [Chloroflexaceae bacterium]|nr:hypothetical protein [Chloroflexaceae bacterium]